MISGTGINGSADIESLLPPAKALKRGDFELYWKKFTEVNSAFFQPRAEKGPAKNADKNTKEFDLVEFDRSVCRMIQLGHIGVADYGWSFFLTALSESARLETKQLKNLAVTIRMAVWADEQTWRKLDNI